MAGSRLILAGKLDGAFGVRGEIRLTAYTADPLALLRYGELRTEDGALALTLTEARPYKGGLVGRAREIATREEAEARRGLRLFVDRARFPAIEDEDEFYIADLIGLAVVSPTGERLGRIRTVQNFGAGDLLEIAPEGGGPSWWRPFTREAAPVVSLARGEVVVAPEPEADPEPGSGPDAEPNDASAGRGLAAAAARPRRAPTSRRGSGSGRTRPGSR
ncbi:MAG: 16S rRNA processing protein RimM [Alphaproteobacteria bacterium]|nr:16S rRNA processing protein RimM [Alphaproteobacteria bacterium]